ncbi:MAG: hypothetical protein IGS48_02790 [Oscillatoriales cyanobacterium C42_A2020_001]|nr:hypothetical protein [Leptolyngbyaceae cyanobacterium C42_A2020_001]
MTSAVQQQESGKRLARYLQEQLKPQAQITPLQVQCAQKETLMILVQHPPGNAPDAQQIFHTLEMALFSLPPEFAAPFLPSMNGDTVKLFLRVLGQQKPYISHTVKLSRGAATFREAVPGADASLRLGVDDDLQTLIQVPDAPAVQTPTSSAQASAASNFESAREGGLVHLPAVSDLPAPAPASLTGYTPQRAVKGTNEIARSRVKPLLLAAGGITAALLLGLIGYGLTRPCVVGSCAALDTARSLSQQSVQTLQPDQSGVTAQQAIQQLTEARRLVLEIPPWSGQYGDAQALREQLDQVLAAEATATSASQKGQVVAQSVTDWQAAQSLWQTAIAQLQAVPQTSPLQAFAQERLLAYRVNLAFVEQRIVAEQAAQKRLVAAQKTAGLAIARQNVAQTLPDWQQAYATWQVAVNTLTQIPNGTMAHTEAQQLLGNYKPKLTEARDRATKEQLARKLYTQATNLEKQAKAFQQRSQWSQASASWQNALNLAKQVPEGTSISSDAQTRAATYAGFVQQAQTVVRIRGDLNSVCLGTGKICDYTITNEVIQVKFVPAYERKVRTLGGISQFSGDYDTMAQINTHLATLGRALQAISNNAGTPIQVYNSDNQLLGSFIPGG